MEVLPIFGRRRLHWVQLRWVLPRDIYTDKYQMFSRFEDKISSSYHREQKELNRDERTVL